MPLSADTPTRYRVGDLRTFAFELTAHAGVRTDIARDVADVLLDAGKGVKGQPGKGGGHLGLCGVKGPRRKRRGFPRVSLE